MDDSFDSQASTVLLPSDTESEAEEFSVDEDSKDGSSSSSEDEISSDEDRDNIPRFVPKLKRCNAVIFEKKKT